MPPMERDSKTVLGMIHVQALPGTPGQRMSLSEAIDIAREETRIYAEAGVDGIIIENMHDVPYLKEEVGAEITAGMTAVGLAVRAEWEGRLAGEGMTLGVQILAGANHAALATALACGASFIRAENFAYSHVADEGLMPTAAAGPLLRYRRQIGAEGVRIFADVKKKHASHAVTADVSLEEAARTAEFFGADGVIVTGSATGRPAVLEEVEAVRAAVKAPTAIGSGLTADNLPQLWAAADVFIVGSFVKKDGLWSNEIDVGRLGVFMGIAGALKG